jgi:hypothetical protein
MITGGITDSDKARESSAVTVFPESTEEALSDKVWLTSVATSVCDTALETGASSLCDVIESVCGCTPLSALICAPLSRFKNSLCISLFIGNVKTCVMSLLEDVKLP